MEDGKLGLIRAKQLAGGPNLSAVSQTPKSMLSPSVLFRCLAGRLHTERTETPCLLFVSRPLEQRLAMINAQFPGLSVHKCKHQGSCLNPLPHSIPPSEPALATGGGGRQAEIATCFYIRKTRGVNVSSALQENHHSLLVPKTKVWLLVDATPLPVISRAVGRAETRPTSPLTSSHGPLLNLGELCSHPISWCFSKHYS